MKALTQAIYAKASGSAFSTAIGARLFEGRTPDRTPFPYAVYFIVSATPDPTFTEQLEDMLIQFSVFSSASSSTEIKDAVEALRALYDDCSLTINGSTLLWFQWQQTTPGEEEQVTPSGTERVWAYHVDYSVKTLVAA